MSKVKVSKELYKRLEGVFDEHGYSSVEELVEHLLEQGLKAYEKPGEQDEQLEGRLRGLGYIE